MTELTLAELADLYLARHAQIRSAATIRTLRHRLARPLAAYGDVPLRELEGMAGELADFRGTLPERFAHDVMRALRQTLAAGVPYGYLGSNPALAAGANPAPPPRQIRAYSPAELDALEAELGPELRAIRAAGRSDGPAASGGRPHRAPRRRPPAPRSQRPRPEDARARCERFRSAAARSMRSRACLLNSRGLLFQRSGWRPART